ncbi:putative quorum-quenching lactonase YtnP [Aquimixticola soesokkakensis]|uniref:Putative quorum-quenching lactonase YtnP n=1 Tax=Aquimixticola soesokkakensis TaxID=1519096 RepID=A0A1Y5RQ26_9RHOB|nr:MBL fold metallo-hydrolase [Aquimixticola soesokkakensis]SLN22682.1 putative quorum-quenching lactonase YtnP [Aquimixticola soesokkakensis]
MMYHRKIGAADVFNIVEMIGPTHDPKMLYPALSPAKFAEIAPQLTPAHYRPEVGKLVIGIQIWVVRLGKEVIVIDTGVGNGKPRGLARFDRLNTLVPSWLAAAGAAPDQVTQVINTHLHGDHVGWNTTADGSGWAAMFPNARYWMPRKDYAHWHRKFLETQGIGETEAFVDAINPLVEAGRVEFYDEGLEFAPGLSARNAFGHTPGMMRVDLESEGEKGVFCADIFHSPLQILCPDINTVIDVEQDVARNTRHAFLAEMAQTGALVMPCHFGAPHCGRIARTQEGYAFVPEGA